MIEQISTCHSVHFNHVIQTIQFNSQTKQYYYLTNWQFQLLAYACKGGWEVWYHIADFAKKIKMVDV
jgi:hypothetical protein